jgi:two-component system sensor histidine kinase AlgZ
MEHSLKGWRRIGLIVTVNTSAAMFMPLMSLVFGTELNWARLWDHFRYGCVYAYCIGTPAFLIMERIGPRIFQLRPALWYPALGLLLSTIAIAGATLANLIFLAVGWTSAAGFWSGLRFGLKVSLGITLTIGTVVTLFERLSYQLQAATLQLRTRQLAETEARLSSLESRIHPHFLFNTLNSISALIREDPPRAERMVERLAALLRYSLDLNAKRMVPLRQELYIVQDYLEIERTRFGERLRVLMKVPVEIEDLEVPPLALQTLVENSIKHAISQSRHGGEIRVTGHVAGDRLVLEVSDDGPGFDSSALVPGHGLVNLQDRLAALFDGAARLEIERRGDLTVVSVQVPQKRASA